MSKASSELMDLLSALKGAGFFLLWVAFFNIQMQQFVLQLYSTSITIKMLMMMMTMLSS